MATGDHDVTDSQRQLSQAIAAADVERILFLLDDSDLDLDHRDVGHDLQTPLMRMCHMRAGNVEVEGVTERLERCAWNPNVQDVTGRTLLMHACIATRLPVVLLCLDNGCDVSLADRDGNSALVYAVRSGSEDVVSLFLELGECRPLLEKKNNLGQTPLDVAAQDGLDTMVILLSAHLPPSPVPALPRAALGPPSPRSPVPALPRAALGPPSPRSPEPCRRGPQAALHRSSSEGGPGLHSLGPRRGDAAVSISRHHHPLSSVTSLHPACRSHLSSREMTSCSDAPRREADVVVAAACREATSCSEVGHNSPRRARRKKQRLQRRQTEGQDSHRDHVSLPDLRDFKGKLVTSGEVTPVSGDNSSSWQSRHSTELEVDGGCDEDTPTSSSLAFRDRYKGGDLSASCSLPPLQSSSADCADRRKDRGQLVQRGKASSTEDVMLRSLIV
ncbi:uncharacterized protein LOC143278091 [Babylonia areolata]|uniref:uncharacterized protein LOC143278091 n=1 Tax=Babylonia areolata TaxID=304850 RepID=UPI003FD3A615